MGTDDGEVLRRRIQQLEDRIVELEYVLGVRDDELLSLTNLTLLERTLLGVLRARSPRILHRESIFTLLYADRPEAEWPNMDIIDVYVCKLRPKLLALDDRIVIVGARGLGYSLPARAFDVLERFLGQGDGEIC